MPPKTKSGLIRVLPVLLGLSGALPAVATEYQAADFLPLAVGNSWTYSHNYYDLPASIEEGWGDDWPDFWGNHQFTIEVLRTEELDGKTYYVISAMPSNWPPAAPHFIAGKTLRWDGTHLMERTGSGEQAIFRFDGHGTSYDIPPTEGDNRVTVLAGTDPVPWYCFEFRENEESRVCNFRAGYGISRCGWSIAGRDHLAFTNRVSPIRAVLGGTSVEHEDALIPTSSSSSSWGGVKQSWLAYGPQGGSAR